MKKEWQPPSPISREDQARKINAILNDYLRSGLRGKKFLEVGCADGAICHFLSGQVDEIVGIEIDGIKLISSPYHKDEKLLLVQADGRKLPFYDYQFDVIILAQVYEHLTNQERLSAEIFRVLKPGGVCFFSGPNRWRVIEPHYFLPFLSWLPQHCASRYLKISGRGEYYDVYPQGYHNLKRLWQDFHVVDYTWQILKDPERFGSISHLGITKRIRGIPAWILKALAGFYPNFNWILVKENKYAEKDK